MNEEEMFKVLERADELRTFDSIEQDLIDRISESFGHDEGRKLLATYVVYLQEVSGIRRLK